MSQAWEIWKDIGYPGTVHVPGEDGRLLRYNFTRDDWERIVGTGKRMLAAGWQSPIVWEHQDATPVRLSRSKGQIDRDFALGVFGGLKDFALTPDGRAKALLSGTDPKDLEQLKKVRFVSPELQWDWTDTDGKTWEGPSVTHLAATPRPVQPHQHPVGADPDRPHPRLQPVGGLKDLVRLSLTARTRPGVNATLRLSLADYVTRTGGSSAMADDTEPTSGPATPAKKPTAWERCAKALEAAGIKIGNGENVKDADHFADLVEVACMNSEQAQAQDQIDDLPPEPEEEPAPPQGDMDAPPEGAGEPPPPPVQMSQTAQKTRRERALEEQLIDSHRERLGTRAARLGKLGYVSPAIANGLVDEVKKVRLSLTAHGKLAPTDVAAKIAAYEKLQPNAAWAPRADKAGGKKARLSHRANVQEVGRSDYETTEDPREDDAVVSAFEENVGR